MLKYTMWSTAVMLCAWCAPGAIAQAATLKIGDPAPALAPTKWIHGSPVDLASRTDDSRIIVLEFWTTWHPSSARRLLALNQLQRSYRDKGVKVISFTSGSERNSLDAVRWRVSSLGESMDHTVAFEEGERTTKAYLEGVGADYYPMAFVIDDRGRLAWFGKPPEGMEDVVLEMVNGTYDIEVAKRVAAIRVRIFEPKNFGNFPLRVKGLDEWIALRPKDARPHIDKFRLHAYDSRDYGRAREAAASAIETASDRPRILAAFARELADQDPENGFAPLAISAADRAAKLAPGDNEVVQARFDALLAMGREAEALNWLERSVVPALSTPKSLRTLADAIALSSRSRACNQLALRIIDGAIQIEPEQTANHFSKFHIQAVCLQDQSAAEATGRVLVRKAWDEPRVLSGFAWGLLDRSETRQAYAPLALFAIERANTLSESKSWWIVRVLAIAKAETGNLDEAIQAQREAIALCEDKGMLRKLHRELRRFERDAK